MEKLNIINACWKQWLPVLVAVVVGGVMYFCFPYVMVAREQSLLFLWNADYFMERLVVPGGLAQYVGEFLTQFFGNPVVASLIYAALCLTGQRLMLRLIPRFYWLSYLPVVTIALLALNIYIPLTLTVAVLLTMALMLLLPKGSKQRLLSMAVLIPVGYWLLGPAVVLLLLCSLKWSPLLAVLLAACVIGSERCAPYPLSQLARGIDYYCEEEHPNTMEEMECDMLLRQKRWHLLASKFSSAESPAVQCAYMLAKYQLGQVSQLELMDYLNPSVKVLSTQSSAFIMSEAYLVTGMVQLSQRCAFEAMESVPNYNKSGRALRRLVETNLVNGNTRVALKYISLLEQTVAFRDFASRHRPLAEHPELMDSHPFFKPLREVYAKSHDTFFY